MSTAVVPVNPRLPAIFSQRAGALVPAMQNELSGGVQSGFPIISYRGKVWRVRKSGEEQNYVDAQGSPVPNIEVVLVKANSLPSKNFFDKAYTEGDVSPPRCYSTNGVRPDATVQNPIHTDCASCPNNVWGSKIMKDTGKKARACSDVRRVVVVFAHELLDKGEEATPLLLRVPPASLNPMKDYNDKTLMPKGIPFFSVVTQIGFNVDMAHPQFTFRPKRFLNDEEAEAVLALRENHDVQAMLSESEFDAGAAANATVGKGAVATPAASTAAATTAPASKPAAMRPATEEEAGESVIADAPPLKAATVAAPAPAPATVAKPRRVAAPAKAKPIIAPAPVQDVIGEYEPLQPTANVATAVDPLDALLDGILNG